MQHVIFYFCCEATNSDCLSLYYLNRGLNKDLVQPTAKCPMAIQIMIHVNWLSFAFCIMLVFDYDAYIEHLNFVPRYLVSW